MMRQPKRRTGITEHTRQLLIHELACHIRASGGADLLDKHQILATLDNMRAFVGSNMLGLIDDSAALAVERKRTDDALDKVGRMRTAIQEAGTLLDFEANLGDLQRTAILRHIVELLIAALDPDLPTQGSGTAPGGA